MGWNMYLVYFWIEKILTKFNKQLILHIRYSQYKIKSVGITLGAGRFMKKADSSQAKLCAT